MEPAIEALLAKQGSREAPPRRRQPAPKPTRFAGIDIIKILACFFVTTVHFFLHSGYYAVPITEEASILPFFVRWATFSCVPLFMITTGYLMKNKTLSRDYYKGIIRVIVLYVVISLLCVGFNSLVLHEKYTAWQILGGILTFTGARYGWYVEYYITIFLLIPFINAGYHALKTRSRKQALLVTVFLLTVVSQSLYIGTDAATQIKLLPGFFLRCYPLAYYLAGVYLRDYPPRGDFRHKAFYVIGWLGCLMWLALTSFDQTRNNAENNFVFRSWHYDDYGAWPVAAMSILLFMLMFDITVKHRMLNGVLQRLSNATFAAYLISYIFDMMFYTRLNLKHPDITSRLARAPFVVIGVFLCSMVSGLLIQAGYDAAKKRLTLASARKRRTDA